MKDTIAELEAKVLAAEAKPMPGIFRRLGSFFRRSFPLLLLVVASNFAAISKHVWFWMDSGVKDEWGSIQWRPMTTLDVFGPPILVPGLFFAVLWLVLLCFPIFFGSTYDRDSHTGRFALEYSKLTPAEKNRSRFFLLAVLGGIASACAIACVK